MCVAVAKLLAMLLVCCEVEAALDVSSACTLSDCLMYARESGTEMDFVGLTNSPGKRRVVP